MTTLEAATRAADRVMHGNGSADDVQLAAGVVVQLATAERWQSTMRPYGNWLRIPESLLAESAASLELDEDAPEEIEEDVRVGADVEVPAEIEERLTRERDDEGDDLDG